jgi:hypothetical protein
LAFSPDGRFFVTGVAGADAIAKIWYAAPMSPTAPGGEAPQ